MLELTHFFPVASARRNALLALIEAVKDAFGVRPFAGMEDQKLADHHWAVESALLRAMRLHDLQRVAEMREIHTAIEREMRRRHLL